MNIVELMDANAAKHPEKTALCNTASPHSVGENHEIQTQRGVFTCLNIF